MTISMRPLPPYFPPTAISNNQQAAMRGAIPGYIFWGFRRIAAQVPYFAVPFAAGYATYVWGKNK